MIYNFSGELIIVTKSCLTGIDSLIETIYQIYKFGYTSYNEDFISEFNKQVINRIDFMVKKAKFFSVEDAYVETEWKDMVALHYINTSYASSLLPHVIRVHLLSDNCIAEENYIGFFTIRPIEELSIALSYVFPNWSLFSGFLDAKKARFVRYKKRIHCLAKELYIETYPILVQDTIVTCCADVNIVTLSRFLSHEYGGRKKAEIRDLCKDDYNFAIPRVIKASYFEELCIKHHVPYKAREIDRSKIVPECELSLEERSKEGSATIKTREGITRYIDSYLDSNLPVVIHCDNHVIQIVGYVVDSSECEKHIVFDDSGYLYPCRNPSESGHASGPVFYVTSLNDLLFNYEETEEDRGLHRILRRLINIGIPQYDRVYIDYPQYETLLEMIIYDNWGKAGEGVSGSETVEGITNPYYQFLNDGSISQKRKSRLVECSKLVMFFRHNLDEAKRHQKKETGTIEEINELVSILEEVLDILNREPLPHYIWYTELYGRNGNIAAICADPTRLYNSPLVDNIFYNRQLKKNKQVILVTESMWDDTKVMRTAEME